MKQFVDINVFLCIQAWSCCVEADSYGRTGWLQVLQRDGRVVKNILANMEMDWGFLRGEEASVRLLGNK